MCMHSCFDEKLLKSIKDYARGQNPTHYYHRMPAVLAQLLDGSRVMVVMEGAKTAKMVYNTTRWIPLGGECMTS